MKKRFLLLFLCIFLMACAALGGATPLPEIPFPTRPAVLAEPPTPAETPAPAGTLAPTFMPGSSFSPILFRLKGDSGPSFVLLGGAQTGAWISPEQIAGQMTQHQIFDFYGPIGKAGRASGDLSVAGTPSPCAGYSVKTELAGQTNNLIGVAEGWPVLTRPEKEFPANTLVYRQAVSDWLVGQGLTHPVIQISRIVRVDLEGDGVDEVFIVASYFKDQSGHMAEEGDYSLVLMRKVTTSVITSPLVADLYHSKDPEQVFPKTYELIKIMDLNRDGKLEVIVAAHFWEGFGAQVYEINGTKPAEVLKYKCGG
jgi:hypothetical protein